MTLNPSGLDGEYHRRAESEVTDTERVTTTSHPRITDQQSGLQSAQGQGRNHDVSSRQRPHSPVVCWMFDDAYLSVYENRDVFVNEGVPAAVAVPTQNLGTGSGNDERMTWAQVQELRDEGWEILSHGYNEVNFSGANEATIEDEIYLSMDEFLDHGILPSAHVYVGGATGGDTGRAIVSELYPFGWGVGGGAMNGTLGPYDLPRLETDNQVAESTIESEVDTAVADNTGLAINGHRIIQGTTSDENTSGDLETSTGKIQNIIDYVQASSATWGTPSDVLQQAKTPYRFESGGGFDYYGRSDGVERIDMPSGGTWELRDSGGSYIYNFKEDSHMRLAPQGDVRHEMRSGNNVSFFNSADSNVFQVKENGTVRTMGGTNFEVGGNAMYQPPKDVRNDVTNPFQGYEAYHDGSGSNTEGPAFYNGSAWVSQVDGSTIS